MQVRTAQNVACWSISCGVALNWSKRCLPVRFLWFSSSPCIAAPSSSCIYLSTTNVKHLGSIKFSCMLKLISARSEVTCCCSFLAWLHVIGPMFTYYLAWVTSCISCPWFTCDGAWLVEMTSSIGVLWLRLCTRRWALMLRDCDMQSRLQHRYQWITVDTNLHSRIVPANLGCCSSSW